MRWIAVTTALLGLCAAAEAREPLARPMERTPSIMVEDRAEAAPKTKASRKADRQRIVRSRAERSRRTRIVRPRALPRPSTTYESEIRSLNGSIGRQLQRSQAEQSLQVDTNLFRQEIQRNAASGLDRPSLGCIPGSIGC